MFFILAKRGGLVLFFMLVLLPGSYASDDIVLAIHPYLSVNEIKKKYNPLVDYLTTALNKPVSLKISKNYESHFEGIGANDFDMALVGPVGYVRLLGKYEKIPTLVRFADKYTGVIATHKNSQLQSLIELKDRSFAFGDPYSTMSHIVPRYLLLKAGIPAGLPKYYRYLSSHMNAALGVLLGDFDAGAMKVEVYEKYKNKGLRILATTSEFPEHLFVARINMKKNELEHLRTVMLRLNDSPQGIKIIGKMKQGLTSLELVSPSDYEKLKKIVRMIDSQKIE